MIPILWVLGTAVAGGVAVLAFGDDGGNGIASIETSTYKGFTVMLGNGEGLGWTWVVRASSDSENLSWGLRPERAEVEADAKAWIDENFPEGVSAVPPDYDPDPDDDGGDSDVTGDIPDDDLPRPPIPPLPAPVSGANPPNYRVLSTAGQLQASQLMQAVEGKSSRASTVFVGADPQWQGRSETFVELRRLAIERPDVDVRVFSFEVTRALMGQPPASPYMAYLAVSVDSIGQPGPVMTGDKRAGPPLPRDTTLRLLFDLAVGTVAAESDDLPGDALVRTIRRPGDPPSRVHIVLLLPRPGGLQWSWQVWKDRREGEPMAAGVAPDAPRAFQDAEHYVQWYQPGSDKGPSGGLTLG